MKTLQDKLYTTLSENETTIRFLMSNTSDLIIKNIELNSKRATLVLCEGMVSVSSMGEFLINNMREYKNCIIDSDEIMLDIMNNYVWSADQKMIFTFSDVLRMVMSGFVVLLIEGSDKAISFGLQGFNVRGISEPSSEANVKGSKESFTESVKINMTMIRRRVKSNTLKFENMQIGSISNTEVVLVYLTDKVSDDILNKIKGKLKSVNLEMLMESGYLQSFLENTKKSIFSGIGYTERPDTLSGKIKEGRIGIIVDGTPFTIVLPYFFNEHFQAMDDYSNRPFYASFIRILKYVGFFMSIFLPGLYVAVAKFHIELLPKSFLQTIIESQENSIFPITIEAIIIFVIYEIMKEAGLRLPRPVGHTVSIIGALLIGDSAVNAGIISAPMVMIVALTAISSFVIPSVYEQVTFLRFIMIILGGLFGLFGFSIGFLFLIINITSIESFDIPFTSPFIPFNLSMMGDSLFRKSWLKLSKNNVKVQNFPGSKVKEDK